MNTQLRHPLPSTVIALIATLVSGHLHAGEIFAVATSSAIESGCDAAFDGDNYLVGVRGGPFGEGLITAQLISPTGALVRGDISPGESGGMPRLAFDDVNYFMVWAGSGASPGFKGQFVDKAGNLVGSVLNLHPTASLTPTATSVAYGGGKYLTCWSDGTRLLGQFVSPDRTLSGSSFTISGATLEPRENAMVFDGANFFVAFNGGSGNLPNIYGQIVGPQGGLVGGTLLIDDTPDPSDNPLTVSFDGSHYLVAFSDEAGGLDSGTWHLYGKRVSTSGTVLPERLTLADKAGAQRFPFAAFDGSNHLVAWGDGADMGSMNLVLRFFSPTGQPVGSEFTPFSQQGANRPLFGVPLFNGTDYFVTAALVGFTAEHDVAGADVYGTFVPKSTEAPLPFSYITNNGMLTITEYTGPGGAVVIPDKIDGMPVASIGDEAFSNTLKVTSVTIPSGVTNIGRAAFHRCYDLAAITVEESNPSYKSVDGILFNRSQTALVQYPGNKYMANYAIPNGVTSIGDGAFKYGYALYGVTIPDSVTTIGDSAFDSCIHLSTLAIPSGVTNIGTYAFSGCRSVTSIVVPDGIAGISNFAFAGCESLTNITLPHSMTNLGEWAFVGCIGLSAIALPDSLLNIAPRAFYGCTNLGSLAVPEHVTSLGDGTFWGCAGLTNIVIPNRVTSLSDNMFSGCTGLTRATIGNGVPAIGWNTFNGCTALASVTVGSNVTNISRAAFAGCSNLAAIYFKGNAPTINGSTLGPSTNVTLFHLPSTSGWAASYAGYPVVLWNPRIPTGDPAFGVQTNRFGFAITGASNLMIVVEAAGDLGNPVWLPVATNTLTSGSSYLGDPEWTKHPARFYRLRSP
jgi:hypothetical protein